MIEAGHLRPGTTIERNGGLFQVLTFDHVVLGRGSAVIRTKLKNLNSNAVTTETFRSGEKFPLVRIERKEVQFLYRDGDQFVMMDTEQFEQYPVSEDVVGDARRWLKENNIAYLHMYEGRVIGVELPITVELEITHTEPGFKGDTATGGTKPATLETGVTVEVPLFVTIGERIQVDTRTGKYMERVG